LRYAERATLTAGAAQVARLVLRNHRAGNALAAAIAARWEEDRRRLGAGITRKVTAAGVGPVERIDARSAALVRVASRARKLRCLRRDAGDGGALASSLGAPD